MNSKNVGNGFTLIELLFVLILLGIITGVSLPIYFNASDTARENAAQAAAITAAQACAASLVTNNTFILPNNVTGTCSNSATFTSDATAFGINTPAIAEVNETGVTLIQKAIK